MTPADETSSNLTEVPRYDEAVLSARDVETGYGDLQVLYGVDVDVRPDEIVLVFGPNGAGKSTLMKVLYRMLPLWSGDVFVGGETIAGIDTERMVEQRVSYVPQVENVFPNLTVGENLDIGGVHAPEPERRKRELFELFPRLEERGDQQAETLSGGERQMLAMARALMPEPDVLLIDEPSAGLAPQLIERAFEHVETVRRDGTAVLMVEQNVKAGLAIADRGYVLDTGENRFEGSASELLESDMVRDTYLGK